MLSSACAGSDGAIHKHMLVLEFNRNSLHAEGLLLDLEFQLPVGKLLALRLKLLLRHNLILDLQQQKLIQSDFRPFLQIPDLNSENSEGCVFNGTAV